MRRLETMIFMVRHHVLGLFSRVITHPERVHPETGRSAPATGVSDSAEKHSPSISDSAKNNGPNT
jgi:hypothetical protein